MVNTTSNWAYLSASSEERVAEHRLVLGGAGLGSCVAETAMRFGFRRFLIIDGDQVEESNLNRQNYCAADVGKTKVLSLASRLRAISPEVELVYEERWLDTSSAPEPEKHDVFVNALDTREASIAFDEAAKCAGIYSLHPLNLGWGGAVIAISPNGPSMKLPQRHSCLVLDLVDWLSTKDPRLGYMAEFLAKTLSQPQRPLAQLSIGACAAAALTVLTAYRVIAGEPVACFPELNLFIHDSTSGAFTT